MKSHGAFQHKFILTWSFLIMLFTALSCVPLSTNKVASFTPTSPVITTMPVQVTPFITFTFTVTVALEATPTPPALSDYLFPSDIKDPLLAATIQTALPEQIGVVGFGGQSFCSYALLMPLQTTAKGETQAYLQVLCDEFFVKEGVLSRGTGVSAPVAFTLAKQGDGWHVVNSQRPKMGNWGESLREIFPPQALRLLINLGSAEISRHNAVMDILYQNNIQQATESYGLPFVPTPAS
jgi:hypothetical protein